MGADAELEAEGVSYDVDLDALTWRGGTLAEAVEAEIASQDAAARTNLSRGDVPDGMDDFCIRPGAPLPASKPVNYHELRSPYVACALCPVTVPGFDLPPGWDWLPDARVCCPDCAHGDAADTIRWNARKRRRGR